MYRSTLPYKKSSMAQKDFQICIVGGGIIGVTTGLALQQLQQQQQQTDWKLTITIISEKWTPNTTGDVSAGLIFPYLAGQQTPVQRMAKIFVETMRFYNELYQNDPQSGKNGVSPVSMFELYRTKDDYQLPEVPLETFTLFHNLKTEEIHRIFPKEYCYGSLYHTFIAQPKLLLPKLMEKFQKQNGQLITHKVERLDSLTGQYDLVINCTGMECKSLQDVHDDQLIPVRGQVIRVSAPWIRHAILADQWYIIPQNDCIVLGGTQDKNNYSLVPDLNVSQDIWNHCCHLVPSLKHAQKIADSVGLRPYRESLLIEQDSNNPKIIHNYGHGGSGVSLCWGSALEVVEIVRKLLKLDKSDKIVKQKTHQMPSRSQKF